MSFSEEFLIAEVKKHEVLYNRCHAHYKKNRVREAAWEEIAVTLQYDCEKCKKRWRTLRDTFIKSRRQEKLMQWSKAGKKNKPWHLHEHMQFLIPYLEMDRQEGDYETVQWPKDSGDDDAEGDEDYERIKTSMSPSSPLSTSSMRSNGEDPPNIFIPSIEMSCGSKRLVDLSPPSPMRKKPKVYTKQATGTPLGFDRSQDAFINQPDPDLLFMLSQVDSLRKMTPRNNRLAKLKIQQILYEYEFGEDDVSEKTQGVGSSDVKLNGTR